MFVPVSLFYVLPSSIVLSPWAGKVFIVPSGPLRAIAGTLAVDLLCMGRCRNRRDDRKRAGERAMKSATSASQDRQTRRGVVKGIVVVVLGVRLPVANAILEPADVSELRRRMYVPSSPGMRFGTSVCSGF